MEELLDLIAGVDEEDLLIKINEVTWLEPSLRMRVEVSVIGGPELGTWIVRCDHALAHKLNNEGVFSLELTDDHPLLWEHTHPSVSAFFSGVPANSDAAVGELYKAHVKAVGAWIPFGLQLNSTRDISDLLSTGNGLLAQGPVPLLSAYKEALLSHGLEVSLVNEYQPGFRRPLPGEVAKVLLLGSSYVVGIDWIAERGDH